jgi:hypothetical protein
MIKALVISLALLLPHFCFAQSEASAGKKRTLTTEDFVSNSPTTNVSTTEATQPTSLNTIKDWTRVGTFSTLEQPANEAKKRITLGKHLRNDGTLFFRLFIGTEREGIPFITDREGLQQLVNLTNRALNEPSSDVIGTIADLTDSSITIHGSKTNEYLVFVNNKTESMIYFSFTNEQAKNFQQFISKNLPKD